MPPEKQTTTHYSRFSIEFGKFSISTLFFALIMINWIHQSSLQTTARRDNQTKSESVIYFNWWSFCVWLALATISFNWSPFPHPVGEIGRRHVTVNRQEKMVSVKGNEISSSLFILCRLKALLMTWLKLYIALIRFTNEFAKANRIELKSDWIVMNDFVFFFFRLMVS